MKRSRVYVDGFKVNTDANLDGALALDDVVELTIIKNHPFAEDSPYVMSNAHWVALNLKVNTLTRGNVIANRLRKWGASSGEEFDLGPNVSTGRIVYLGN